MTQKLVARLATDIRRNLNFSTYPWMPGDIQTVLFIQQYKLYCSVNNINPVIYGTIQILLFTEQYKPWYLSANLWGINRALILLLLLPSPPFQVSSSLYTIHLLLQSSLWNITSLCTISSLQYIITSSLWFITSLSVVIFSHGPLSAVSRAFRPSYTPAVSSKTTPPPS